MTSSVYLRIEKNEALAAKKNFLEAKISFINLIKSIRDYRLIRKSIFFKKQALKKTQRELMAALDLTLSSLPKIEQKHKNLNALSVENIPQTKKDKSIEQELAEIKRQLSALNA